MDDYLPTELAPSLDDHKCSVRRNPIVIRPLPKPHNIWILGERHNLTDNGVEDMRRPSQGRLSIGGKVHVWKKRRMIKRRR